MSRDKAVGTLWHEVRFNTYQILSDADFARLPVKVAGPGSRGLSRPSGGLWGRSIVLLEEGGFLPPTTNTAVQGNTPIVKDRAES